MPLRCVQAQPGGWPLAAFTCPVLPAAFRRRNTKGIWKLVFTGRVIKLPLDLHFGKTS